MLSICTFLWGTKYTHEHVLRLGRALRRNLTIPFRFVLISDQSMHDQLLLEGEDGAPDFFIPLWTEMNSAKLCGVRLKCFDPEMEDVLGERFAWIDLDVVITGNVDHIFGRTEDFIALQPPRPPMPINGSLVMMNAGARPRVYLDWTPHRYVAEGEAYSKRTGVIHGTVSDEGWMAVMLGDHEAKFTAKDGIYYFRRLGVERALPADARMVVFNGRKHDPANEVAQALPWVRANWT